jgi:hypothetical protein
MFSFSAMILFRKLSIISGQPVHPDKNDMMANWVGEKKYEDEDTSGARQIRVCRQLPLPVV